MTVPTSTIAPDLPDHSPAATCGVCAHPAATHDVIGRRFCEATFRAELTRGCVCRA